MRTYVSDRVSLLLVENCALTSSCAISTSPPKLDLANVSLWYHQKVPLFHILAVVGRAAVHGTSPSLPCLVVVDGRGPPAAVNGLGVHVVYC